jgi:hypothetical protein
MFTCTHSLVALIICRPYAVVVALMARQGILPTVAPAGWDAAAAAAAAAHWSVEVLQRPAAALNSYLQHTAQVGSASTTSMHVPLCVWVSGHNQTAETSPFNNHIVWHANRLTCKHKLYKTRLEYVGTSSKTNATWAWRLLPMAEGPLNRLSARRRQNSRWTDGVGRNDWGDSEVVV